MLSHVDIQFFVNLLILNAFIVFSFILIHKNYFRLANKIEEMTATSRYLDEKQKRILRRLFPFYKKLSPELQRIFEKKLLYFYFTKKYERADGQIMYERMKLFVSAYAAQVSLGFREYGFSHIHKVIIYPTTFKLQGKEEDFCWQLDANGILHLSWKDFFEQLKKEVVLPIGLQIMAHAIKGENEAIKDQIFESRFLLYHQMSLSDPNALVWSLFEGKDFGSKEDFLEACLKNYLCYPMELKNSFPDLFRKLDKLLYSQLKLS
jgi:hypothetical protein